ncbi:MAG: TonB-dependent receptor [Bdellovibrionaceae bacterium]|nr:TonB-dependent receptor [Pseudobdellovibrionaceae bacterium]
MLRLSAIFLLILNSNLVFADDGPSHHHKMGKIVVLGDADQSTLFDNVQNVTTLSGDKLLRVRATSLGETLKNEVGVSSTSYGPNSSRPVIRGLDGDRIRILQNGLGVLDASGASQDHAVSIDPLLMDGVEIVRGPLSLLYGSSAIGGVVNILTNRTHGLFEEGLHGAADTQLSTVDNGKTIGFKADYGVSRWMHHIDGNFRDNQDVKINGFARSERLRAIDPLPSNQEVRDKQLNSGNQSRSGAIGTTYVGEDNIIGVSLSSYSSDYGVVAEPEVLIAMEQSRFDLTGEFKNIGFTKKIQFKSAQSVYKHQEVEAGAVGTTFKNNGNETRLEFVQNKYGALDGIYGIQSNIFNFSALGDESFLPKTENAAQALFVFEQLELENSKINFGLRGESNRVKPIADSNFTQTAEKSFFLGSAALGHLYKFNTMWSISTQLSYSERAPNYQELFANGAHVATFSYQVGDSNLDKEKVNALEFSLRHKKDTLSTSLTVFGQKFKNYIALSPTGTFDDSDQSGTAGDSPDDLPIFNYLSQDAEIYGAELDSRLESAFEIFSGRTDLFIKGDYLRGKNTVTGDNLPRITPPRASVGVTHTYGNTTGDVELQHVFEQTKTAPNELATDGYSQLNMGLLYKYNLASQQYSVFARANNIFNAESRNHVSILKDLSQIGGRNYSVGIRAYF